MNRLSIGAALVWATLAAPLAAQENPVVVELFTSQGCSSCPPADMLLSELGAREDIIALALHVDYWDYIGWKDRFALPQFTRRQKGYARAQRSHMIYTPQMVVDGARDVVGSKPMKVIDLIQRSAAQPDHVRLSLSREGDTLHLRAEALPGHTPRPCDIHLVRYLPFAEVTIETGENAGRTLGYSHVVQRWDVVATWDGTGIFEAALPLEGDAPAVVLVQEERYGPILAAARLR